MIQVNHAHLPAVALSDPGRSGKNNEDRFAVSAYRLSKKDPTPVLLAMLADGIGGHRAGEVAAEMTVDIICHRVAESDGRNPVAILEAAIVEASQKIYTQAQENLAYQGMGATCACVWIIGARLYAATVGDSRIYLLRRGTIQQLSTDHTWVQEALENGILQPDQIRNHPNAHVIRRYLGSPTPPQVDFRLRINDWEDDNQAESNQGLMLQKGDRLLLCSDGLTDLVMDEEILAVLESHPQETAARTLIALANERGGYDNITLIALEAPEKLPEMASAGQSRSLLTNGCLAVTLLAALAAALALGISWLRSPAEQTATPTLAVEAVGTAALLSPASTYPPALPTPVAGNPTPSIAATLPLPVEGGATLTPWPTNTLAPSATPTLTPSVSLTPNPDQ